MIDLHCHTNISDGYLSTYDAIKLARQFGIKYLSITNHDTTIGLTEAEIYGEELGVKIIPGIEISAFDFETNKKIHIIGYLIDYKDGLLDNFCRPLRERRDENSRMLIEEIKKHKYNITIEEIEFISRNSTNIFKQHIMHGLINKGYCNSIYNELYYDFFSITTGKINIPLKYIDMYDAVKAVKDAKGIAVLAHPRLSECTYVIPELVKHGLDGIEVKHSKQDEKDELILKKIAYEYNLLTTGGSDFHGFYGHSFEKIGNFNPGIGIINKMYKMKESMLYSTI